MKTKTVALVIWILAVMFYFYEYVLRVAPSVMVPELMRTFSVSATSLGMLTAFYLFAYAPMQLFVGALYDHFRARVLLTIATFLCGFASVFFGFTGSLIIAEFTRFIMGFGSAFAFVGLVFITSHYFPKNRLALLVGIGNSIGTFGAVFGQGPLSLSVISVGWRMTMIILGGMGIILGGIIFLSMHKMPLRKQKIKELDYEKLFRKVKKICKNRQTWINSLVAVFFYSPTVAFAGLWAVPFYENARGLDKEVAAFGSSMIYLGMILGFPIIGHFSDYFSRRKPFLTYFSILSCISIIFLIYLPTLSTFAIFSLSFLLGIFCSAQALCYSLAVEINAFSVKGTSIALTNFIVFLGGAIIQPLVGFLLDFARGSHNDTCQFSMGDYQIALSCFPIVLLLAFIFSFFLKEPAKNA